MKAIRVHEFGEPEIMQIEDVSDPAPGAAQVVVAVKAAGVNPVDTYLRAGAQGYAPDLPYTPGLDAAGITLAVGEGVTHVSAGDRVYCAGSMSGTYAEKVLCEASQVHALPEPLTFSQGASVNVPYATAFRALYQRGRPLPGETVLVHGASGGVGLAAIQLARSSKLTVIGTAGTEESRQFVHEHRAHHGHDPHKPDHVDDDLDLTDGHGVDVILEMLANVTLGRDLKLLGKGGRVVVIGSRGPVEIDPRETMKRDTAILGMSLMNTPPGEVKRIHPALAAGLENGSLCPVVGKELPLSEAAEAHHLVIESPAFGNITLIP